MDIIKWIWNNLVEYEKIIDELDNNLNKLESYGPYDSICDLPSYRFEIPIMIAYLDKNGGDTSTQQTEFNRINNKYLSYKKKWGNAYTDKLFEILEYLVERYSRTICTFLELDEIDLETDHALFQREEITFLFEELENDYDVQFLKERVIALDKVLKCKFDLNIDLIRKCPGIEVPYFPEKFWWRHPSTFNSKNIKIEPEKIDRRLHRL